MHDHIDTCPVGLGAEPGACHQIAGGIGRGTVGGPLGTDEHHRFGDIPEHERQCCSGVSHGVGSVGYDNSVGPVVELLGDSFCELLPVLHVHVLGEYGEEDTGIDVGDIPDLGDSVHHVGGGQGGVDGTGPVIHIRCDGSSGSDEDQFGEAFLELHLTLLLRPLDRSFQNLDLGLGSDPDTDVVPALHLQDEDVGSAELVMGHQSAHVCPVAVDDGQLGTFGGTEVPKQFR